MWHGYLAGRVVVIGLSRELSRVALNGQVLLRDSYDDLSEMLQDDVDVVIAAVRSKSHVTMQNTTAKTRTNYSVSGLPHRTRVP